MVLSYGTPSNQTQHYPNSTNLNSNHTPTQTKPNLTQPNPIPIPNAA